MMMTFSNDSVDNGTEFNCLARDNLSSSEITNRSVWRIRDELQYGTPVVATVLIIFFLISFCWNLFIIVTFFVKYRLLKEPGNILLLNLAVGDFLVSITTLLFSLINEIAQEFIFGPSDTVRCAFCTFTGILFTFLLASSLHTLAALSIDRFLLLSLPLRYKNIMKISTAVVIIFFIWTISFIIAIMPVVGFGQVEFNQRFGYCIPRFTSINLMSGINNYYYPVLVVIEAIIVMVIIIITSISTYRIVAHFLKANFRRRSTYGRPQGQQNESIRHQRQQKQLVKVFGALLISNLITYTPVVVVIIIFAALPVEDVPGEVFIFGWICYLTTPVVHPIIESFFVKDLRIIVEKGQRNLRRASTLLIRQSTSLFRNKDLDLANKAMDAEDSQGVEKPRARNIVFFSKDKHHNDSVHTEVVSMSIADTTLINNSPTTTISPGIGNPLERSLPLTESADKHPPPAKRKRRITFSDEDSPSLSELAVATPLQTSNTITEDEPLPLSLPMDSGILRNVTNSSPKHEVPDLDTHSDSDPDIVFYGTQPPVSDMNVSGTNSNGSIRNNSLSALVNQEETLL